VTFASVSTTTMTVNWTRGSGAGVIVLMKQGAAWTPTPSTAPMPATPPMRCSAAAPSSAPATTHLQGDWHERAGHRIDRRHDVPRGGLRVRRHRRHVRRQPGNQLQARAGDGQPGDDCRPRTRPAPPPHGQRLQSDHGRCAVHRRQQRQWFDRRASRHLGGGSFPTTICANVTGTSPGAVPTRRRPASATYYYQSTSPMRTACSAPIRRSSGRSRRRRVRPTTPRRDALAAVAGCSQINVTAPFTGDADNDGAVLVEYSSGVWTTAVAPWAAPAADVPDHRPRGVDHLQRARHYSDPTGVDGGAGRHEGRRRHVHHDRVRWRQQRRRCHLPFALASRRRGGTVTFQVQIYDKDGLAPATRCCAGSTRQSGDGCDEEHKLQLQRRRPTGCSVYESHSIRRAWPTARTTLRSRPPTPPRRRPCRRTLRVSWSTTPAAGGGLGASCSGAPRALSSARTATTCQPTARRSRRPATLVGRRLPHLP